MEALGMIFQVSSGQPSTLLKSQVIQEIHETYVAAGADLITTSSYQATLPELGWRQDLLRKKRSRLLS